jgi:hypothetical protein
VESDGTPAAKIDTSVAHPARVYDFWLGGKDHYPADAEAGQAVVDANPGILPGVRANRAFLGRAVRFLVAEAGVTQILDIGTGLPSANNVHQVAQEIDPGARIVYVDNDPIVLVHAHALLTGTPGTIDYLDADLRDPAGIVDRAAGTLDFDRPIALLLLMTLQFVTDDAAAYGIVSALVDALAPGSYLVLSHPARTDHDASNTGTALYNQKVATAMVRRSQAQIARFFDGLELVEPGLVPMAHWRPAADAPPPPVETFSPALGGVARKP